MAKGAAMMLLVLSMALAAASEAQMQHGHRRAAAPHGAPTHLHFYFHDTSSGPKPSARKLRDQLDPKSKTMFGLVMAMDDLLTAGPKAGSAVVGRAQGLYMGTYQSGGLCLLQVMNLVLTVGPYNGSSLAVLGRNCMLAAVREMPVIGGTGAFRYAQGHATLTTNFFDLKTGNAIVEYDVYVMH